ncbi:MAG: magnesium transporter [Deltaproteobacteria bacterium GWB2_55_19]|nr:MAG: magnesium transporter [Deltaproteobacteria bacterium GWB2_55_19]HAO92793.1 magnesium transporter [Deltaproteobacteria bacterium]
MTIEARTDHTEEVKPLLEAGNEPALKELLSGLHASDIGRVFSTLGEEDAVRVFKLLEAESASEVLLEVDERLRKTLISSISSEELIDVVHEMETDDAADVISELPLEDANQVLEGIDKQESIEVRKLLAYPEDTAGGKMQAELVSVPGDATVEETIEEVRRKSRDIEHISNVFVVDRDRRLLGTVSLDRLILASPRTRIIEIADREPRMVGTDLDQEEVAKVFQRYDLISLPVVDHEGRLVGRITVDDVVDVLEEEIFEDFYKMAGLNIEERVMDQPRRSIWMRAPWLFVNLGTAFLAASVVKVFQGTIEHFVILAVLMPIVAGMGGNAATQAITVVVRGLALGELSLKNARWILVKEATVGLANGLMTGMTAGAVAYAFGVQPIVGLILFLAMTFNLVIAGLSGSLIPLVLKRFNVDPAISSSIFVTTCTDIGGFFTFLGLATVFMKAGLL